MKNYLIWIVVAAGLAGVSILGYQAIKNQPTQPTSAQTCQGTPKVDSFTATPAQITSGSKSTLAWTVTNASYVSIDNNIGKVVKAGIQDVTPSATTTYTITAVCGSAAASAQATVTVSAKKQTCDEKSTIQTGFKLYQNNTYKYCIQYESDWKVDAKKVSSVRINNKYYSVQSSDAVKGKSFLLDAYTNTTIDKRIAATKKKYEETDVPKCKNEKHFTLNGAPAASIDCASAIGGDYGRFYFISRGSVVVEISGTRWESFIEISEMDAFAKTFIFDDV